MDGRPLPTTLPGLPHAYIINACSAPSATRRADLRQHGRKWAHGPKKLVDSSQTEVKRATAWAEVPQFDAGPGLVNLAYGRLRTGEPYPIRATMLPPRPSWPCRTEAVKRNGRCSTCLVAYFLVRHGLALDVVLPLSTYWRVRASSPAAGLKPQFFVRKRVQENDLRLLGREG